jgi:hypothetical protein
LAAGEPSGLGAPAVNRRRAGRMTPPIGGLYKALEAVEWAGPVKRPPVFWTCRGPDVLAAGDWERP